MINASARYPTVEDAKFEMSPPDFSGVTAESFMERVRTRHQGGGMAPGSPQVVMANFEIQADKTIKARLSRANHLRIIEAFWGNTILPRCIGRYNAPPLIMPPRAT
ncbi:MAG: hypothetical protein CM1200mP27_09110 [Chloroflexota bacterium]|nr:MAG: hypothetical protein CM1200mP27_09110 [Chloroflexota bacterium]